MRGKVKGRSQSLFFRFQSQKPFDLQTVKGFSFIFNDYSHTEAGIAAGSCGFKSEREGKTGLSGRVSDSILLEITN